MCHTVVTQKDHKAQIFTSDFYEMEISRPEKKKIKQPKKKRKKKKIKKVKKR